jgi:hypothetical protein
LRLGFPRVCSIVGFYCSSEGRDGKPSSGYCDFEGWATGLRGRGWGWNTVAEVDVRGGKIPRGIDLGANHRPHLLALSRDGRRLWAACAPQQAVVEVSTESTSGEPALKAWKTGQAGSYLFALTRKICAANFDAGSVVDRGSHAVHTLSVGRKLIGVDVRRTARGGDGESQRSGNGFRCETTSFAAEDSDGEIFERLAGQRRWAVGVRERNGRRQRHSDRLGFGQSGPAGEDGRSARRIGNGERSII